MSDNVAKKLDMSLDDIVKDKKKSTGRGRGRGRGGSSNIAPGRGGRGGRRVPVGRTIERKPQQAGRVKQVLSVDARVTPSEAQKPKPSKAEMALERNVKEIAELRAKLKETNRLLKEEQQKTKRQQRQIERQQQQQSRPAPSDDDRPITKAELKRILATHGKSDSNRLLQSELEDRNLENLRVTVYQKVDVDDDGEEAEAGIERIVQQKKMK